MFVRPDYLGFGFANLVASAVASRGGLVRHVTHPLLPPVRLERAERLVFLVVDGLGDRWLARHGAGSALAAHRLGSLTTVFPSTTATAITTSFTGATPQEHGLTGWYTSYAEFGVVAPLTGRRRGSDAPLEADTQSRLYDVAPWLDGIADPAVVVTARQIVDSAYNRFHSGRAARLAYDTLQDFVAVTLAAAREGEGRRLVYAYWPEYDTACHRHGCESAEALAAFAAFDRAFEAIVAGLAGRDVALLASADHGFVDSTGTDALSLDEAPPLAALLAEPLSGEPRVAFCRTLPGRRDEFIERARAWLGDRAEVRRSSEFHAEGWFGTGTPHPAFASRIADVTILMRGRCTLKDRLPGEPRHLHVGHHGGAHEDEMMVPLCAAWGGDR